MSAIAFGVCRTSRSTLCRGLTRPSPGEDAHRGVGAGTDQHVWQLSQRLLRVRRRALTAGLCVALALSPVVGCATDSEGAAEGPGPAPPPVAPEPAPTAGSPPESSPDEGCLVSHPRRTELIPIAPLYEDLVEDLRACLDEAETTLWVANDSLWVWVLETPPLSPDLAPTGDPKVDAFRALWSERSPTHLQLEPGRALTLDLGEGFLLLPDAAATTLWQTISATATFGVDRGLDAAGQVFAGDSPGRSVMASCGLASYDAIETALASAELEQKAQQAPILFIQEALGLGTSTSACGDALEDWRRSRQPHLPALADDFALQLGQQHSTSAYDRLIRTLVSIGAQAPRI